MGLSGPVSPSITPQACTHRSCLDECALLGLADGRARRESSGGRGWPLGSRGQPCPRLDSWAVRFCDRPFPGPQAPHLCEGVSLSTVGPSSSGGEQGWGHVCCLPGPAGPAGQSPSPGRAGLRLAHLAGVGLAVEVAGAQHVGADVGPVHLGAAALVVGHQGHQRLPQGAGVAAHVCRQGHVCQGGHCSLDTTLPAAPTATHSRPGGPSLRSGTCVRQGRGCWAQAGRWAGRTGSGRHSGPPSSSAGSGLGGREARGQPGWGVHDGYSVAAESHQVRPAGREAVTGRPRGGRKARPSPRPRLCPPVHPSSHSRT